MNLIKEEQLLFERNEQQLLNSGYATLGSVIEAVKRIFYAAGTY